MTNENQKWVELAKDWPKDPANGRFLCESEHPRPSDATGMWSHAGFVEIDEYDNYPCGYMVVYKCKDCGIIANVEQPQ